MTERIIIRDEAMRGRVLDLVRALNLEKPWEVTVKRHSHKRSLSQNALYWKWVGVFADHTGHSPDEIHETLKGMYLLPRVIELAGKTIEARSTTWLTTDEMKDYMDRVYALGLSEGLMLPVPEEMGR